MSLAERAAYLKGLADGLELKAEKKETRIIKEMLDLMVEMAGDVDNIGADLTDLYDAMEQIDEDLSYVEQELFGDEHGDFADEMYEIVCPNCQETVHLDEEMLLGGDVICPACGEKIEIEIDSCDCCHDHGMEEEE